MIRRTLLAAAAGALAAAATAAPALAQQQITWWYENANPEQQRFVQELLIAPFNAANPAHSLGIDYRGDDLDKQLRIAMLSGAGPDIVYTAGPSYVATMAQAGQLMALDGHAATYGWESRILPVFIELGRYDGQLYALPKTYETLGLFYSRSLFAEHGWTPPETIAEMEALAAQMLAMDIIPFSAGNAGWRPTNEWYVSIVLNSIAGPDNVYRALTGQIPWTAEPFVRAIAKLQEWWQAGYFGDDYFSISGEQAFANLATGRAAMSPVGTWAFQYVPVHLAGREDEVGFIGFPSAEGVPSPVFALGIGSTFSISAAANNPDGAAEVLDFIFTDGFYSSMNSVWQGEWHMPLRDLSNVRLSSDVLPLYTETMRTLAAAVDANQYGYTSWTFLPPATNTYLVTGIEEVWFDRITPQEYLAALDEKFRQEMAEGKVPAIPAR